MSISTITKTVLSVATSAAALLGASVGAGSTVHAAPLLPMNAPEGPVNSYLIGETLNCFVDYRMWVARDPQQPHRVVGNIQPTGVRSTIPGLPAPQHCSTTVAVSSSTGAIPLAAVTLQWALRLEADQGGGRPIEVDLPYEPNSGWVRMQVGPGLGLTSGTAIYTGPLDMSLQPQAGLYL
ncbi:hypothetical protein ACFWUP_29425 [Nocardia sp. NPDC058658]|uniref:hypothetical protein n=1 Tax=Nocardia sp. NPDC058658 TaxID=3346580 RepID=UPI003669B12D